MFDPATVDTDILSYRSETISEGKVIRKDTQGIFHIN